MSAAKRAAGASAKGRSRPSPWTLERVSQWLAAVETGDLAAVSRGIAQNAPLEEPRPWRSQPTALLLAAASGRPECLALLLSAGASVAAVDRHGHGLAYWAVCGGSDECLRLAIDAGCDIEARGDLGDNAGAQAAASRPEALRRLLRAGLDARAVDSSGQTLLMLAARFKQPECVRQLLEAGADVDAVSMSSRSAAIEAMAARDAASLALLSEAGCDLSGALEAAATLPIHTEGPLSPEREREIRSGRAALVKEQLALREARALEGAVPKGAARRPSAGL